MQVLQMRAALPLHLPPVNVHLRRYRSLNSPVIIAAGASSTLAYVKWGVAEYSHLNSTRSLHYVQKKTPVVLLPVMSNQPYAA